MKGSTPKVTKDLLEELYLKRGLSTYKIGEILGVNAEYIRRRLIKFGIKRRQLHKVPSIEEVKRLYIEERMTIPQIAEYFNVKPSTIAKWISLYRLKKQELEGLLDFKDYDLEATYESEPARILHVPLPLELLDKKGLDVTLTLVISDTHFGHADFLPKTFYSTVNTLLKLLPRIKERYNIVRFNIVLNGDIVSGREVYEFQELSNLLPRGHWQVFLGEIIFKELIEEISSFVKVDNVYFIKGTHESLAENYVLYLKRLMKSKDIETIYCSRGTAINIAEPIGKYNIFFTHGSGSSAYYPVSYHMIRELWKINSQTKVPIERFCLAHSHWLTTDLELEGLTIDVCGAFQRWEKTFSQRPCGMILYLYIPHYCSVIKIRPDIKIETEEKKSLTLEYSNIKFYGEKLLEQTRKVEGIETKSLSETSE